jgi:hypothetical protein
MSPIKRILQAVLLPALAGLLTGCQHALPADMAAPRTAAIGHPIYEAQGTAHLQKVMFTKDSVVKPVEDLAEVGAPQTAQPATAANASAPTAPESLTLQLGDCLLGMLKLSTGH